MGVFHIVRYQKPKMHANHLIWGKETLQKKCLLSVLSVIRTKTIKRMDSSPFGKSKHYEKKKNLFSVFHRTYQNLKTHARHPL